ncbi:hypothetical protein GBQ70_11685 [Halomicrobium sp. ZPS1]|uniref:Uncharacterized protein n=3 Tax=Haloarculaceae TaxID=1963268 RepID=C7P404_HALMD|nr:hypothetical protein Hmuk_1712 [Halomicrobium mukohataei DSM 12286]QCD66273.1 hypothetical protein E5139_11690 [Halomicrobium mukohataei]QFR21079.1 hypothetical protein GBQ70_11685 [Halomicrobium sp. ZPS1]
MGMSIGLGTVAALLSVLVAIELAQLEVLRRTAQRSRSNRKRLRALLRAFGVHDEGPTYDVDADAIGEGS